MRAGILILVVLFSMAANVPGRTFKNKQGKEIEASVVAAPGDNVTLMRADGKKFTFPVKTLSDEDQKFVAAWKKANPDINLDYDFKKTRKSRSKKGGKTVEQWVYEIEITNRSRTPVEGLQVKYYIFRKINDRYAKKRNGFSGRLDGEFKIDTLEAQKRSTQESKQLRVESENSSTDKGSTVIMRKWDESMAGIYLEVFHGERRVDTHSYGELPAGLK